MTAWELRVEAGRFKRGSIIAAILSQVNFFSLPSQYYYQHQLPKNSLVECERIFVVNDTDIMPAIFMFLI